MVSKTELQARAIARKDIRLTIAEKVTLHYLHLLDSGYYAKIKAQATKQEMPFDMVKKDGFYYVAFNKAFMDFVGYTRIDEFCKDYWGDYDNTIPLGTLVRYVELNDYRRGYLVNPLK